MRKILLNAQSFLCLGFCLSIDAGAYTKSQTDQFDAFMDSCNIRGEFMHCGNYVYAASEFTKVINYKSLVNEKKAGSTQDINKYQAEIKSVANSVAQALQVNTSAATKYKSNLDAVNQALQRETSPTPAMTAFKNTYADTSKANYYSTLTQYLLTTQFIQSKYNQCVYLTDTLGASLESNNPKIKKKIGEACEKGKTLKKIDASFTIDDFRLSFFKEKKEKKIDGLKLNDKDVYFSEELIEALKPYDLPADIF